MKRTAFFLLALILCATGCFTVSSDTAYLVYAKEAAPEGNNNAASTEGEPSAPEGTDGETAESETELQPVLLDTDQVSTEDILLYSSACVVMDTQTGAILYSKNRTDKHYPASTTKILTTLLALEHTKLTDDVTFSQEAIESITWDSSNMELKPGDELTMEQALYGVMLQSANEAAYGVAEYVSGSSSQFAKDMTDDAIELGCRLSHFTNASGLHDDNHYTTAKDLATIARAAAQNENFRKITGTITYSVENINYKVKEPESDETAQENSGEGEALAASSDEPVPEPFLLYNHHKMVNNEYPYEGCYGGKTGYTGEARNTLVTYAKRGDIDLICVLLDCPGGKNYTYMDTELALDYCFDNYERLTEEYNNAQALLNYPDMGLRDWYHPEKSPLSVKDGLYPNVRQATGLYITYLHNRKSQEALDKAISDKSVHAFMEYSRLNNYRPLIIAGIILFIIIVILSLLLVYAARVLKRKRSRRRYEKLKQQRLAQNAANPPKDEEDSNDDSSSEDKEKASTGIGKEPDGEAAAKNDTAQNNSALNISGAADSAPKGSVSDDSAPSSSVPDGSAPSSSIPDGSAPSSSVPDGSTPNDSALNNTSDRTLPDSDNTSSL